VNWGNYDLVVIDESHNFRNKKSPRQGQGDALRPPDAQDHPEGVKTRVLMLSATPVNNRLADLRNQIAFVTEGDDTALAEHGIASIEQTTRKAQASSTAGWHWTRPSDAQPLVEMLGFDYFTLLDHLTIARSRGTSRSTTAPARPAASRPAAAHQHQGRRGPAGEFRAIRTSTWRSGASTWPATRRCATCCRTSRPPTTPSTAPRFGRRKLLPAGRPRREPDPPAARERAQAHGKRGVVLHADRAAPTPDVRRCWRSIEAPSHDRRRRIEELDIADVDIDDPAFETCWSAARSRCCWATWT
jgi:hypothetical protein